MTELTPDLLLRAYAIGYFPWPTAGARRDLLGRSGSPGDRSPGRLSHPRSLRKTLKRAPFAVTVDRAFPDVVAACARASPGRENTWINRGIERAYTRLHRVGHAHSVECWADGRLVRRPLRREARRGLLRREHVLARGPTPARSRCPLGGAPDPRAFQASRHPVVTGHLSRFGAAEIPRAAYRGLLAEALAAEADFYSLPEGGETEFVQSMTQMS